MAHGTSGPARQRSCQSCSPQREKSGDSRSPDRGGSGTGRTVPAGSIVIPSASASSAAQCGAPGRQTRPPREAAEPGEDRLLVGGLGLAGGRRVPAERPGRALQKGERRRQPDREPVDARASGGRSRKTIRDRLQCGLAEDQEVGAGEEAEGRGRGLADEPEPDLEVEAIEKSAELGRVAVGLVLEVLLAYQCDHGPLVQVRWGEAGRERCVRPERGPFPS